MLWCSRWTSCVIVCKKHLLEQHLHLARSIHQCVSVMTMFAWGDNGSSGRLNAWCSPYRPWGRSLMGSHCRWLIWTKSLERKVWVWVRKSRTEVGMWERTAKAHAQHTVNKRGRTKDHMTMTGKIWHIKGSRMGTSMSWAFVHVGRARGPCTHRND